MGLQKHQDVRLILRYSQNRRMRDGFLPFLSVLIRMVTLSTNVPRSFVPCSSRPYTNSSTLLNTTRLMPVTLELLNLKRKRQPLEPRGFPNSATGHLAVIGHMDT